MSIFAFVLSLGIARAQPSIPPQFLPTNEMVTVQNHGPDGPPPDGGYKLKDDGGENTLGKLGVLCLVGGTVTTVLMLTAEDGSDKRQTYQNATIGLFGAGVGFIILERAF